MTKLGVGLISCGVMGTSLAKACNELEHARIVAVSDIDKEKAEKLAKELNAPYDLDYHNLLGRKDVEAVIVASPGFLHREMTVAAAKTKKHVFSEKPMATNLADCDAMIAACREAGVKLMVGQVCRFHGVHSKVKELASSGEMGKPTCMMVARIGGGWGGVWAQSWRMSLAKSGGALMEINAHEIDFMRFVCGDVQSVQAVGGKYRQLDADYPDIALVSLRFKSGAVGLLHSSMATAIGAYGGRVDCANGSINFPTIWGKDAGITYGKFGEAAKTIPAADIKVELPVRHELRCFVDAVLKDETPAVPGEEGRAAVEVAVAAYRSIETGKPVELPLRG